MTEVVQAALLAGWSVRPTKHGYALFPPNPDFPALYIHRSLSDHRAPAHLTALIERFS